MRAALCQRAFRTPPVLALTPSTARSRSDWPRPPGGPTIVHTLTREQLPPGWRSHALMLAEVGFPPAAAPRVLVCGPTPIVEAEALLELGHEPGRIRTVRFGATEEG